MGTGAWMLLAGAMAVAPPAPEDPCLCASGVARPAQIEALNAALRALVTGDRADAPACARRLVAEGLPTASLLVLLDALNAAPPAHALAFQDLAFELAHHRRPAVRARALPLLAAADAGGGAGAGSRADWSARAVLLALADPAAEVRAVGLRLAAEHPAPQFEGALLEALAAGELEAAPALAACATPGLLPRLPGLRVELGETPWTRLVGALLRRPGALAPIQRLALVTSLATMGTAESQDQLRAFLRSGVGASPPVARNLAARALGLPQAPPADDRPAPEAAP